MARARGPGINRKVSHARRQLKMLVLSCLEMLLFSCLAAVVGVGAASTPLYKNPKAPIEARVSDLLGRMTVQDKVSQMYVCIPALGVGC